jgi:hypothetical protein
MRDRLHAPDLVEHPAVIFADHSSLAEFFGLERHLPMRAEVFECTNLAVAVLQQHRHTAERARREGVGLDERGAQCSEQPEAFEDARLFLLEDSRVEIVRGRQSGQHVGADQRNTNGFAGLPTIVTPSGTSRMTTLPAPMTAPSPTFTPGNMVA